MSSIDLWTAVSAWSTRVLDRAVLFGPSLLAAIALAVTGWLLGRLLSRWSVRLIDRFAPRLEQRATEMAVTPLGVERRLAEVIGTAVYWLVFAVFLAAAAESLGLPVLATWIAEVGELVPRFLVGGLLVLGGLLVGTIAHDATTSAASAAGMTRASLLGRAVQVAIVTAAVVTGMDQVGLDSQFVTVMITVTVGGLLGGTALAFAFGARVEVGNMVAMHYLRQSLQVGQTVSVAGVTGRVREFSKTAVVLDSAGGRARVPASIFSAQIAEVVTTDE